jgi:D-beta-D-heptose 7-phosphate kinase/D-beta-D-heptose 1-phosphate adenosyltransferase
VFTNGCFDILHAGHVDYLEFAKSQGDKLVVAVNSDDSVRRLKGDKRPVNSLNMRLKLLAGLRCVDYVLFFNDDTPINVIKSIMPDTIVKGSPYKTREEVVGHDIIDEIIIAPANFRVSSSHLMEYI